ncbi:hypothetical protein V7S43_002027 [Phytophthora oleae]|uniref:Protein kinase domain-containing protein n=1 Tax=Phytophthora oleae TaxID=2107226 RepID=A0ABD3G0R8_9STRA
MVSTLGMTIEATLSELEQLCTELPDFGPVNQSVLSRLKDVFFQLQAAVDPLSLDAVESLSLILVRFDKSLERRGIGGGSLVSSVCASRTIANKNYSIHRDLDRLIQNTPQLQNDSSIHSWLPQFQVTQDNKRATLQGYLENLLLTLKELDGEDDQSADAALLKFEARNHGDEFTTLGGSRRLLPKWFIPSYQVELGRHIADGSFGYVYEGKWLGTDVVVKLVMTDQRNDENRRTGLFASKIRVISSMGFAFGCLTSKISRSFGIARSTMLFKG